MSDRPPPPPALHGPAAREIVTLQTICLALILAIATIAVRIAANW
ncbi:hypothetical protein [Rhodopseudomonas sp. B29]|nr:hypothetical protein [Rhodopseudomonas sp. B29]